jgi:hypothetical protein
MWEGGEDFGQCVVQKGKEGIGIVVGVKHYYVATMSQIIS